jgi:hypothetical protein
LIEERGWEEGHLFEILEVKNADATVPAEVGHGYFTREQALAAATKP